MPSAMLPVFTVAAPPIAPVGPHPIATYIWRPFDQGSVGRGRAVAFVATTLVPLAILSVSRRLEAP